MKYPRWTDPQFLDADGIGGLNTAMQTIAGAMADIGAAAWATPGLLAPDAITIAASGMALAAILPPAFGVVSSSGSVVRAHGIQTGLDSDFYLTDFTSLVPSSGSVRAFLAATVVRIMQDPFPIPGPPPGFPSFNPNYVPTIGYASNVDSLMLSAVTGGIDNANTFEIAYTDLIPGQTSIASFTTADQFRAPLRVASPQFNLASGGVLTTSYANRTIIPEFSGLTFTLPPTHQVGGLTYSFANPTSGAITIATTSPDVISGVGRGGVSSLAIGSSGSASFWANGPSAQWQVTAGSFGALFARPGYRTNQDGSIEQWFSASAPAGGGLLSTIVNFPFPFPNGVLDLGICFGGPTPPGASAPGSISIDFRDNASCTVVTNFAASITYGPFIRALGY